MASSARGANDVFPWTALHPALLLAVLLAPSCVGGEPGQPLLTAEMPLHLEDHLDAARIEGSEVPTDIPEPVEWRFDEPQPDWKPVVTMNPNTKPVKVERTDDALRLTLDESNHNRNGNPIGGVVIELPQWDGSGWGSVLVRARGSEGIRRLSIGFNTASGEAGTSRGPAPYEFRSERAEVISDGTVQTYLLQPAGAREDSWDRTWDRLMLWISAWEPATFEVLSVTVVPDEAGYADAPVGTRPVSLGQVGRQTIYSHAPGRISYRIVVPQAGRFDVGLGVLRRGVPVTFRVAAEPDGGERQILLEHVYVGEGGWEHHSVDLMRLQGQTVTLSLEAETERPGTVALWGAPILSGARTTDKPNVVLYVIDGAAADLMSVYGYNRRTTPNLERLAAEGALFERAYSNSSWTLPSTASFMTSLHNSVLGGTRSGSNVVPEDASTLAQHMHRDGYQTAVFVANANAGRMSGLDREVDLFRESWEEFTYGAGGVGRYAESSRILQGAFWQWRDNYPGAPYWVHFQTTDTHVPWLPVQPFAGLFLSPERRQTYDEWERRLQEAGPPRETLFERAGVDPEAHYQVRRSLYDEAMAHTDYQIGQLVERLKAAGEWESTLFIVASDHSHYAAGLGLLDARSPDPGGTILSSSVSRIPMIVVWPGRIAAGQRFSQPVSMIDVLPTILDLVGLPLPEVMQGQSLAPLLLGKEGWEPRPVILDEFDLDRKTGELRGLIEVIDGRWGASLEINPWPAEEEETWWRRPVPLLLYDLWNDPLCLHSLHEERPGLVEKYTNFLEAQWAAHQELATQFTPGDEIALTPEQLRTLRALGYIQ